MSSGGGKMPEYTMLTPLPLTPDVLPHDFEQQLVSLGLTTLPCELVPHHYSPFVTTMVTPPLGHSTVVLENGDHHPSPPRSPEGADEDEDEEGMGGSSPTGNDSDTGDGGKGPPKDPFAPQCKIPLPTPYSPYEYWLEPSFIRRRNERERQRVRNVNDGFERLKSHLPIHTRDKEKRLSKVEILRMAIRYIRNLQDMLRSEAGADDSKENVACVHSESD